MVTMFATLLSFANESSFFTIKNDAEKTSLTLENVKAGNLLSIIDDNGMTLYKELIQKPGIYTKGFDLTSLPDGNYTFELDKDVEITTIPFSVNSNIVLFNKELEKTIYKPIVRVKNEKAYITKLSLNKEPLEIKVYFTDADIFELVHTEKIENTQNIEKIYELTGLGKGSYKLVFKSEGKEFSEFIN